MFRKIKSGVGKVATVIEFILRKVLDLRGRSYSDSKLMFGNKAKKFFL
jgi:hypothetical protein